MPNLGFSFTPGAGYTGPYTIVAFGATNPSIPLGQVVKTGYGSVVNGSINGVTSDAPYTLKIYTNVCQEPVGTLNLP